MRNRGLATEGLGRLAACTALVGAVLAVADCKGATRTGAPTVAIVDTTVTPSASAAPSGSAPSAARREAAASPTFHSFSGLGVYFAAELHGSSVRAVIYRNGAIELRGTTDGTHFDLKAVGTPKGERPVELVGTWSDDGLRATLTGPRQKTAELRATDGPFDPSVEKYSGDYKGWLAGRLIRMKIERDGPRLHGVYRYTKSAEEIALDGTVDAHDGSFTLTESVHGKVTGGFSGVFASIFAILATWSSADGSRSIPVLMESGRGEYPATVDLANGLTLYPQEIVVDEKACGRDILYPQVRGAKDKAKEAVLNVLLRGDRGSISGCDPSSIFDPDSGDGFTNETMEYAFLTSPKRARFVSLSWTESSYTLGAAHPNSVTTCTVIDTQALTQFRLAEHLTEEGRARLAEKVGGALGDDGGPVDEPGFIGGPIEVKPETNVCLLDKEINVHFGRYELGAYFLGEPEVAFPKASIRDLFERSEVMDALFAQ
jgi:hypothetical protein